MYELIQAENSNEITTNLRITKRAENSADTRGVVGVKTNKYSRHTFC